MSGPPGGGRRAAVVAGHEGDGTTARALLADPDPGVRASAMAALDRAGRLDDTTVEAGLADTDPRVRMRAAELAIGRLEIRLVPLLSDPDDRVVEQVAWACGERSPTEPGAPDALALLATGHADPLCREAAVAALGAIGDPAGLAAILAATTDRPAVRRRAVLALAPFDGPEVDAALTRARADRDWQVRQAAEDLSE